MENYTKSEIDYFIAKESVRRLKKLYFSLAFFIVVFAFYSFRRFYLTGDIVFLDDDSVSSIFWIWAIILVFKGVKILVFNENWENKMIRKELKQNQHGNF